MAHLNLITDVPGLAVGHAGDLALGSGTTVLLCETPSIAGVDVRGGSPGTRETDLLAPGASVDRVDAIVLSGGSAFGLDAASGAMDWLAAHGRGFAVGPARVPIVPAAILFDLLNGGDKAWGSEPPYRTFARAALDAATDGAFALGSVGAGTGACCAGVKGGLGSASAVTASGHVVGALVAVNAVGSPLIGGGPHLRAAPYERDGEFGGLGLPPVWPDESRAPPLKTGATRAATTIGIIATDATLSPAQARRFAVMAQDGFALSLFPVHTPLDGDCVFSVATGRNAAEVDLRLEATLGATAALVMARAVARAVYEARALPYANALPAWRDLFAARA
ncbi:P1 family peptidase [Aquabacter cavernae]|uniref:P1 family peptidase n=1 Tax=Aquabacter cavernae TaxID=2496029 RepID=UPI000F8C82E8|nr:P1 family peptidase [Aquabacter cavernae]